MVELLLFLMVTDKSLLIPISEVVELVWLVKAYKVEQAIGRVIFSNLACVLLTVGAPCIQFMTRPLLIANGCDVLAVILVFDRFAHHVAVAVLIVALDVFENELISEGAHTVGYTTVVYEYDQLSVTLLHLPVLVCFNQFHKTELLSLTYCYIPQTMLDTTTSKARYCQLFDLMTFVCTIIGTADNPGDRINCIEGKRECSRCSSRFAPN